MDDIQSWWEVPSIAHFCSLFRAAFNLLDFDIEDLEVALLTDGAEDSGSSLLQELIVRLLCGCLGNNDISTFNYQMFLRRLFRQKCQEYGRNNPFNTDIDFQFLPLRTKVEILHALCDFRLDADDVQDLLKNLESDSLRVVPLGYDDNDSAYWYFYGTRLYREDFPKRKKKAKEKRKKGHEDKRRKKYSKSTSESDDEEDEPSMWQVVCFSEQDWDKVTYSFKNSTSKCEKALFHTLAEDFLPEIPRLFAEKERLQRKRQMEYQPRRQSTRLEKLKQQKEEEERIQRKEEQLRQQVEEQEVDAKERLTQQEERSLRALHRSMSHTASECESTSSHADSRSGYVGRQTNNSLSSATGQIVIQGLRRKLRSSQVFRQSEEDLQIGLYKILDHIKSHEDAWPFTDPVDEAFAPRYYSIISKPMDLKCMEDKLDEGRYNSFSEFKADFQLIVDNCRQYNGTDNEYTEMVGNLLEAFKHASDRYLESDPSSDEEIAVEFPQDPPEKHLSHEGIRHRARRKKKKKKKRTVHRDSPRDSPRSLSTSSIHSSESEKDVRPNLSRSRIDTDESSDKDDPDSVTKRPSSENSSKYSKSNVLKNAAAIEALELATEQTLKDINKWLDDTPRFSEFSSASNSPSHYIRAEEYEIVAGNIENDYRRSLKLDKSNKFNTKDKRRSKDPLKLQRRREIQRTIDRLQPGKSKGNLISNMQNVNKTSEDSGGLGKLKDKTNSLVKTEEAGPKLSLGTVLTNDVLSFGVGGQSHNFDEELKDESKTSIIPDVGSNLFGEVAKSVSPEPQFFSSHAKKDKDENSEKVNNKDTKQEKATPNLSAWFKAFGAPKPAVTQKKKPDVTAKSEETMKTKKLENSRTSPSPTSTELHSEVSERMWADRHNVSQGLIAEDQEKKLPHSPQHSRLTDEPSSPVGHQILQGIPRQRRVSTGSSVSERSSFSQDMDGSSPRITLDERLGSYPGPYPSPLHRSPMTASPVMASPRSEDIPKLTPYPPINGTIRVGFYQDTSSSFQKNSPEKSPRDRSTPSSLPEYSPRLYSTPHDPGGFVPYRGPVPSAYDNMPSYGIAPLMPYYDTKSVMDQYKSIRTQSSEDYSSPSVSDVRTGISPKTPANMFPVKKRLYSEMESGIGPTRNSCSGTNIARICPSPHSPPTSPNRSPRNSKDLEGRLYSRLSPQHMSDMQDETSSPESNSHVTDRLCIASPSPQVYPSNLSTNKRSLVRLPQTGPPSLISEKMNSTPPLLQEKLDEACGKSVSSTSSQISIQTQQSAFDKTVTSLNNSDSTGTHCNTSKISNLGLPSDNPVSMVKHSPSPIAVISRPHQVLHNKSSSKDDRMSNTPETLKEDHHSVLSLEMGYHRPQYTSTPPTSLPVDSPLSLRGNIPHIMDRYNSEDRIMHNLQVPSSPFFGNKSLFGQTVPTTLQVSAPSVSLFPQTSSPSVTSTVHEMPPLSGRIAEMQSAYTRAVTDLSMLATKTSVANTSAYGSSVSDLSVLTNKVSSPLNIPPYMRPIPSDLSLSRKEIVNSEGPRIYNHPNADLPPSVLSSKVSSGLSVPANYSRSPQDMSGVTSNKISQGTEPTKTSRKKKAKQSTTLPETPVMTASTAFQQYVGNKSLPETSPISLKTTSIPGSAFNFGPPPTALGLYGDKEGYPSFLEEYRTPPTGFYVGSDPARDKQNTPGPSFPFLSHPQARPPAYPFINQTHLMEPSSPLYQQYLQRHQEELLRHSGTPMVLHQGLLAPPAGYPPGYHPALSIRQPYDTLNRPSWL